MQDRFRSLPSVDRLLQDERVSILVQSYSRAAVVDAARQVLEDARRGIAAGQDGPCHDLLVRSLETSLQGNFGRSLRPVINATGVVIHTNLGRAPLSGAAVAAMVEAAASYSNLEYNLEAGERGHRQSHLERLLRQVTGAEAGIAVSNNAAALLLALSALAKDREVIVSRGQAVEIGGGFRIPDVMRQSGARLVEVGTTNRTYLSDYESSLTPETAALLRVHSSNFRVIGFTHSVELSDLVELAERKGLVVIDDLGSGALLPTERYGLAHEPTVQESVAAGAAVTLFSGDKLLGGPQAGIVVGKASLIERLRRHPLARATRMDKLTIAALEATLLHYAKGEAESQVPVWQMISAPLQQLEMRARQWLPHLANLGFEAAVVEGESTVGGGSLPGEMVPTRLVALQEPPGGQPSVAELATKLRRGQPPVVARVEHRALLLDPRTVLPGQDEALLRAVREAVGGEHP